MEYGIDNKRDYPPFGHTRFRITVQNVAYVYKRFPGIVFESVLTDGFLDVLVVLSERTVTGPRGKG